LDYLDTYLNRVEWGVTASSIIIYTNSTIELRYKNLFR